MYLKPVFSMTIDYGLNLWRDNTDEEIEKCIQYLKSYGLHPNMLGWVDILTDDINEDSFMQILREVGDSNARIRISLNFQAMESPKSEWYIYKPDRLETKYREVPNSINEEIECISACDLTNGVYLLFGGKNRYNYVIKEDLIDRLKESGIYCKADKWFPDVGKFRARQYYYWEIEDTIDNYCGGFIVNTNSLIKKNKDQICDYFSKYSKIAAKGILHYPDNIRIDNFAMPVIIQRKQLNDSDVKLLRDGEALLVNSLIMDIITRNKFDSASCFTPVITVNNYDKLKEWELFHSVKPNEDYKRSYPKEEEVIEKYRELLQSKIKNDTRPEKIIIESMAINRIKNEMRKFPNHFNKGLNKSLALKESNNPMIKYLAISNGFFLGNEYYIYSLEEQKSEWDRFINCFYPDYDIGFLSFEKIIGCCLDGDPLVLMKEGMVKRYNIVGKICAVETWDSIKDFIYSVA